MSGKGRRQMPKKKRTTVVLESIDLAIVGQVQKDQGVSRSAAVRILIRRAGGVDKAGCQQAAR